MFLAVASAKCRRNGAVIAQKQQRTGHSIARGVEVQNRAGTGKSAGTGNAQEGGLQVNLRISKTGKTDVAIIVFLSSYNAAR